MQAVSATETETKPATIESRNPTTGELIAKVPNQSPADVDRAVERARRAALAWGGLTHAERRDYLLEWRREWVRRLDDVVQLVHDENGKTKNDALGELMLSLSHLTFAATRAGKVMEPRTVPAGLFANFRASVSYQALGVIGVIGPWNYPLFTPMGSIGYALATGNAVVFKPSELTPLCGQLFEETARAAIPIPDLVQVVTGDGRTGAAVARAKVDKVAFTGSAATGRKVMMAAAERLTPVLLELGGKDAMIVASDADVARAAESAVFGALQNAGQACTAIERVYVVEDVYDRFVDEAVKQARDLSAGEEEGAKLGAMTSPAQVEIVREHIEDALAKGAKAVVGGSHSVRAPFIDPVVLIDVTPNMKIMAEETFGPVLPIAKVRSVDEAVERTNDNPYGLGSSLWGKAGLRRVADGIRAGATSINSALAFAAIPSLPFGGVRESGFGRIHGDDGLREFCRAKSTAEERFQLPVNMLSFNQPKDGYATNKKLVQQLYGGGVVDRIGDVVRKLKGS